MIYNRFQQSSGLTFFQRKITQEELRTCKTTPIILIPGVDDYAIQVLPGTFSVDATQITTTYTSTFQIINETLTVEQVKNIKASKVLNTFIMGSWNFFQTSFLGQNMLYSKDLLFTCPTEDPLGEGFIIISFFYAKINTSNLY